MSVSFGGGGKQPAPLAGRLVPFPSIEIASSHKCGAVGYYYHGKKKETRYSPAQPRLPFRGFAATASIESNRVSAFEDAGADDDDDDLYRPGTFASRHMGTKGRAEMLAEVGVSSLDELIGQIIPNDIRMESDYLVSDEQSSFRAKIPKSGLEERVALKKLESILAQNQCQAKSNFIGLGFHPTFLPPFIKRNIAENPTWYTAYTPYQSEIAQGRLESLMNFQTLISELTGLPVSVASLLDEASAAGEAMGASWRISSKSRSSKYLVDSGVFDHVVDVLKTRAKHLGIEIQVADVNQFDSFKDFFGVLVQQVRKDGSVVDNLDKLCAASRLSKTLVTVSADPLALCILEAPGRLGSDFVVGSTQRFGVPMGCGGPHAAFLSTHQSFARKIPGRIIGETTDSRGNVAYRMALQVREQHIKREKATSNICTSQVLLAHIASFYAMFHGRDGLIQMANRVYGMTGDLLARVSQMGVSVITQRDGCHFDTIAIEIDSVAKFEKLKKNCESRDINLNFSDPRRTIVTLSLNECTSQEDVNSIVDCFSNAFGLDPNQQHHPSQSKVKIPESIKRSENHHFLQHGIFGDFTTEIGLTRYMKRLESKDLGLDRSMIPLGSCTMKFNSASTLDSVFSSANAQIHPFAPPEQMKGTLRIVKDLEEYLSFLTGFDACSLQPNSGATGEFAGLLAIRSFQKSIGESHRNICVIPVSAHGTNPASAAMAGLQVRTVGVDKTTGQVSVPELRKIVQEEGSKISCLMITYPSTFGRFDRNVREVCDIIHEAGGQIYLDGANMNAELGLSSPGLVGADVCHLNLHKTFAIPHGGGGPGVGPICCRKHLAPFLPSHRWLKALDETTRDHPAGAEVENVVCASPFGSAMVLPISWMFINCLGLRGLRESSKVAMLKANYLISKLKPHFPVKFAPNKSDRCGHEFILNLESLRLSAGVTEEDVAKRLMDYGFHAPTVSWPVAHAVMIEPTESEPIEELDRFVNALIEIKKEASLIQAGVWPRDDNPIKNAPHTLNDLLADCEWSHPYSKMRAFGISSDADIGSKFWPASNRVQNAQGDLKLRSFRDAGLGAQPAVFKSC